MERLVIVLFWLAFMLYAVALLFYAYLFTAKKPLMGTLALSSMSAGLVLQSLAFLVRWYAAGYIPLEGNFESFALFAWFVALSYLIVELLTDLKILGILVMPIVLILLGVSWSGYGAPAQIGVFQSSWVILHVVVIFVAYGGFTLAAGLAVLYLIQERQLRSRRTTALLRRLPSLMVLDNLSFKSIVVAEPFMTMGIITGIIRAVKDMPDWYIDPFILSIVFIWAIYAIYLIAWWRWGWQGRRAAILSIVGFLFIVFARFVIMGGIF